MTEVKASRKDAKARPSKAAKEQKLGKHADHQQLGHMTFFL